MNPEPDSGPAFVLTYTDLAALLQHFSSLPNEQLLPSALLQLQTRMRTQSELPHQQNRSSSLLESTTLPKTLCSGCQRRSSADNRFRPYDPQQVAAQRRCARGGTKVRKARREWEVSSLPFLPRNVEAIEFFASLVHGSQSNPDSVFTTTWVSGVQSFFSQSSPTQIQGTSTLDGLLQRCASRQANCVGIQFLRMLSLIELAFSVDR